MPMIGSNGSTTAPATNYARPWKAVKPTIAVIGSAAISTAQSPVGAGSSLALDGAASYVRISSNEQAALSSDKLDYGILGANLNTIHCYVRFTDFAQARGVIGDRNTASNNGNIEIISTTSGTLQFYTNGVLIGTSAALSTNTWYHLAITINFLTVKFYINGTLSVSGTLGQSPITCDRWYWGVTWNTTIGIKGYIGQCQIVVGSLLWESNFTPPASPLDTAQLGIDAKKLLLQPIKAVSGSGVPSVSGKLIPSLRSLRNLWHGGNTRVYGTVKLKGTPNTPVKARVRLFRDVDAICVGETWSDPATGAYEFRNLDGSVKYTALAYDTARTKRAVVADNLTAEVQ